MNWKERDVLDELFCQSNYWSLVLNGDFSNEAHNILNGDLVYALKKLFAWVLNFESIINLNLVTLLAADGVDFRNICAWVEEEEVVCQEWIIYYLEHIHSILDDLVVSLDNELLGQLGDLNHASQCSQGEDLLLAIIMPKLVCNCDGIDILSCVWGWDINDSD